MENHGAVAVQIRTVLKAAQGSETCEIGSPSEAEEKAGHLLQADHEHRF